MLWYGQRSLNKTRRLTVYFCLFESSLTNVIAVLFIWALQTETGMGGGGRIIGVYGKPGTGRGQFKCDGTRPETKFRLSAERTSPFKSAGTSVQSTTGSWRVRISGSNAGYTMFRGSVKGTGYPLHSPFSPSIPLPCFTVCHHISVGVYPLWSV